MIYPTNNRKSWLAAVLLGVFLTWTTLPAHSGDKGSIEPVTAKLSKKGKTKLMGKGFKAGQRMRLLFVTSDGVESDINEYLKPDLKAGADGSFSVTLSYGRFVKKKLAKAGTYGLVVTDGSYNALAKGTITFTK